MNSRHRDGNTLRRIVIKNFRSIVDADLTMGDITVVVGPSDAGKSNLVRAIETWAYSAIGTKFTTFRRTITRVAVAIRSSHLVIFEKSSRGTSQAARSVARYMTVDGETGERLDYLNFGRQVPEEIDELTGIRSIKIDDDLDIRAHVSRQDEPWFLLSRPGWSPARVVRVIGSISGVDRLLSASRDQVNKRVALNKSLKATRIWTEEVAGRLSQFGDLDGASERLTGIKTSLERLENNEDRLKRVKRSLRSLRSKRDRFDKARGFVAPASNLLAKAKPLLDNMALMDRATEIVENIERAKQGKKSARVRIRRLKEKITKERQALLALAGSSGLLCPLCGSGAHGECRAELERQAG